MYGLEGVAVFWDYENCPIPSNNSGYSIVDNIRSLARPYGSIKLFKAYLEISDQAQRSIALRSELQSSGVSLVDCPHNGRKDVADKMIIVDMFAHAIDTPALSTVVLITGDRDFAYAISTLKLRMYRVVLVTLSNAHASLTAQASVCLDWNCHVLAPTEASMKTSRWQEGSSTAQEKSRQLGRPIFGGDWLEARQNNETSFPRKIRDATNERLAPQTALNSGLTGARGNTSQGSKEPLYESTNSIPMRPSAKPFTSNLGSTSVVKNLVNTLIAANPLSEIASSRDQSITPITPAITKRNQYGDLPDSNEPSNLKEEDDLEDLFVQPLLSQPVPGDSSLSNLPGSSSSTIFLPSILTGSSSLRSTSIPSKAPAQSRQPPSTPFSELYTPTYHNPNIVPPAGNPSAQVVTRKNSFVSSKVAKISPPVVKETSSPQPTSRTWNNFIPASQPRSSMEVMSSRSVAAPCSSGMDPMSYVSFDSKVPSLTSAFGSLPQHTAPVSKPANGSIFMPSVPSTTLCDTGTSPLLPVSAFTTPMSSITAPAEYSPSTEVKSNGGLVIPSQRAATVISSYTTGQALPVLATSSPATATSLPPSSPVALNPQTSAAVAQEASSTIGSEGTSDFVYYSCPSSPISARAFQRIESAVDVIGTNSITCSPPARPQSLPNPILYPVENDFTVVSLIPQQPVPLPKSSSSIASTVANGSLAERPSPTDGQSAPLTVPENFRILVQCLQTHRSKGILQPLRKNVSREICQKGTTYKKAGVQKFKQYVALAEEMGIIELGGLERAAWIRLKPDWYNATSSAPAEVSSIPIPSAAPKSPSVAVSCTHLDMGSTGSPVRTEESNGAEPSSPKPVFATPLQPADVITNPSDHGTNSHVPRAQSLLLADVVVNTPDVPVIPISLILPESPESQKSASPSIVPEMTFSYTSTPAIDPGTPNVVPEIFKVLVQCLRTRRSKGIEQPFRTDVAMELNKDKTTYVQAGITSFEEYTVMAKRQGIIELGGQGEGAWIHLNLAYWHEIPSVIPTPPLGPSSDSLSLEESPSGERRSSDSTPEPPAQVPASASQLPPSDGAPIPSAGSAPSSDTIISSSPDVAPNSISPKPSQSLVATSTLVSSSPVVIMESNGHPPAPAPVSPALPQLVTRAPPVVPELFKPLVICLQSYRSRGVLKPLRRNIATEINKNKATYKKASVDRFNSYTALAKKQGIIELSGKEEGVWMALKPKWYDAAVS